MLKFIKLFPDQQVSLSSLDDATCGKIVKAMMAFAFNGEDTSFDNGLLQAFWVQCRNYIDLCDKKSRAGTIGGSTTQRRARLKSTVEQDNSSPFASLLLESELNHDSSNDSINDSIGDSSTALSNDSSIASSTRQSNIKHTSSNDKSMLETQDNKKEIYKEKSKKRVQNSPVDADAVLDRHGIDGELRTAYKAFIEMRNADSKKKIRTENTLELIIKKVNELASDGKEKIAILEQSTRKGWMDVFAVQKAFPKVITSVSDIEQIKKPSSEQSRKLQELFCGGGAK